VPATVTEPVAIAPGGRVFDLPVILGIGEGSFERAINEPQRPDTLVDVQ
jgi:hypothetical protein